MINCPSCSLEVPGTSRFCSSCGAAVAAKVGSELPPTVFMADPSLTVGTVNIPGDSYSRISDSCEGRFQPGVLVADRYRLLGLI
ncbi:MAG: hypothetical protein M3Y27_19025, partial [Acidobacteriota bacterium]|nr:hypothetical protein [Acidobacteriota bacterium]